MRDERRKLATQASIEAAAVDKSTADSNSTEIEVVNVPEQVKRDSCSDADSTSNTSADSSSESNSDEEEENDERAASQGEIKLPWEQKKRAGTKSVLIEELGDIVENDLHNDEVPPLENDVEIIDELQPIINEQVKVEGMDKSTSLGRVPTTGEIESAACKFGLGNKVNDLEDANVLQNYDLTQTGETPKSELSSYVNTTNEIQSRVCTLDTEVNTCDAIAIQNNEEIQKERLNESDVSSYASTSSKVTSVACKSEPANETNLSNAVVLQNNKESLTEGMAKSESSSYVPTEDEIRSAACKLVDEICETAVKFCLKKQAKLATPRLSEPNNSDEESCSSTTVNESEAAMLPEPALPDDLLSKAVWKYFSEQTHVEVSMDAKNEDTDTGHNGGMQVFEFENEIDQEISKPMDVRSQSKEKESILICERAEGSKPQLMDAFEECESEINDPLGERIASSKIDDVIDANSGSIEAGETQRNTLLLIDNAMASENNINDQTCDKDYPNKSLENIGEVVDLDGNGGIKSALLVTHDAVEQIKRESDLTNELAKASSDQESSDSEAENNLKEMIKHAIFPDMKLHTQESDHYELNASEFYTTNKLRSFGKDDTQSAEVERARPRWDCDERTLSSSEDELGDDINSFEDFLARTEEVLCELGLSEASVQDTTEEISRPSQISNQSSATENTPECQPSDTDLDATLVGDPQDSSTHDTDQQSPSDLSVATSECVADTYGLESDTRKVVCAEVRVPATESKCDVTIENKYTKESSTQNMTKETDGADQESTGSNVTHQDAAKEYERYFTETLNYVSSETNNDEKAAERTPISEEASLFGLVQECTQPISDHDDTDIAFLMPSKVDAKLPASGSQMDRGDIFLDNTIESGSFKRVADDESDQTGVMDETDSCKKISSARTENNATVNEAECSLFLKTVQEDNVD